MSLDDLIAELGASSLSDTEQYRIVCRIAATNPTAFTLFRSHSSYTRILEHVTEKQGQQYLDEIRIIDEKLLEHPQWFKYNDDRGSPAQSFYTFVGQVSPTTLRYVKVLADLRALFGAGVPGRRIVEVGGGYGGQARIWCGREILTESYTIVDLPEPLMLAEKFLSEYRGVSNRMHYVDGEAFTRAEGSFILGDLFISNYALTECAPDVMTKYVERIAVNCAQGYVTGNAQEKLLFELLAPLRPRRIDEVPLTGPGNFICVWGDK